VFLFEQGTLLGWHFRSP